MLCLVIENGCYLFLFAYYETALIWLSSTVAVVKRSSNDSVGFDIDKRGNINVFSYSFVYFMCRSVLAQLYSN